MWISSLLSQRKRTRLFKRIIKKIKWSMQSKQATTPIFVFGKQRSGTTLFMDIMENRPDTEVYQEWEKSVFTECRIRNFSSVDRAIESSHATYACFKPICDSHIINEFITHYPDGKIIWVYRNFLDNANSAIRRFPESDKAMRLICEGKPGGGWLQEGISDTALKTLQAVYSESLGKFEISCLSWWARNSIILESGIADNPNVYLLKYESLVREPEISFEHLRDKLGLPLIQNSYSNVHDRSIAKNIFPEISPAIREICEALAEELDRLVLSQDSNIKL